MLKRRIFFTFIFRAHSSLQGVSSWKLAKFNLECQALFINSPSASSERRTAQKDAPGDDTVGDEAAGDEDCAGSIETGAAASVHLHRVL